jgi:hypothetical protein
MKNHPGRQGGRFRIAVTALIALVAVSALGVSILSAEPTRVVAATASAPLGTGTSDPSLPQASTVFTDVSAASNATPIETF